MTETFVKERKHNLTGKVEPLNVDDASAFLCRFANGSLATFESTRYARGHKALYTLEINGEHASASWDLHDLHRIEYFDHRDGLATDRVTDAVLKSARAFAAGWVAVKAGALRMHRFPTRR
jgi:predicted dehydrogenase